jgi:chromate transport protein ChrA
VITANQLIAHMVGDYIIQSDWMANNKTKWSLACFLHVITYALPFLFFRPSLLSLTVIVGTHFIIDRWWLARFIVWLKNAPYPRSKTWQECSVTGYPPETPAWLAVWLMIIADNIMHILINGLALRYL